MWTRRNGCQWSPAWRRIFQAGFVVQVCSLVPSVPLWLISLSFVPLSISTAWEAVVLVILSVNVVGGALALGAWRSLMAAALPESPPSIFR